jgi:SAM-dependent methyltransferase
VPLSHFFLSQRLQPGDKAIDATCGNGQDTLLMARLVGEAGHVWAFDIQEDALCRTGELLAAEGVAGRVTLHHAGHERLRETVTERVKVVVFNLGYLPGGDHTLTTNAATTVAALQQSAELLLPGGIIVVALYTGQAGGVEEEEAVVRWGERLSPVAFNVWVHRQLNRSSAAPYLLLLEKV